MEKKLEIKEDILKNIKEIRTLENKNINHLKTIIYSFGDVSSSLLIDYLENDKNIEYLRNILFNKMFNLKLFKNREEFDNKIKKDDRLTKETNILFEKILNKSDKNNNNFEYLDFIELMDPNFNEILKLEVESIDDNKPFIPKCLYCDNEINDGSQLCGKTFCYVEFDDSKKIKERINKRKRYEKLGIHKFILPKPKENKV
jgi:hypothetical protein